MCSIFFVFHKLESIHLITHFPLYYIFDKTEGFIFVLKSNRVILYLMKLNVA